MFHGAREHPHAIAQQTAVGRIVNISLHHRRIDPQLAARNDLLLLRDRHHALMNALDALRPQGEAELAQGLGVRHSLRAHARELAIDQVRAHLTLEDRVAPVADVLQQQQAQHDFHRRAFPTTRTAVGPASSQCLVDGAEQLRVGEHVIDVAHPVLPQVTDLFGDESVGEVHLAAAQFNHLRVPPRLVFLHLRRLLLALKIAQQPLTVIRRNLCPQLLKAQPRGVRALDRRRLLWRHIDRIGLALGVELQIQVRAVAARWILEAGARGVAALAGDFGQRALNHRFNELLEVSDYLFLTSHTG